MALLSVARAVSRSAAAARIGSIGGATMFRFTLPDARALVPCFVVACCLLFTLLPAALHAQAAPVSSQVGARYDDPLWDGAVLGALAGAGAMAGLVAIGYAQCDAGCEAPAEGPMYAAFMGFGAASGAGVGWLIDKLHKGKRPSPVAVAITADRRERAVRVQWRF
jgi:hypothetical protein